MQDVFIAAILCFLGLCAISVAAVFAFKQKVYVDTATADKVTEIDVPLFGKLRTNTPAIALTFVGAIFGYFAYDLMKKRVPEEVPSRERSASTRTAILALKSSWLALHRDRGSNRPPRMVRRQFR